MKIILKTTTSIVCCALLSACNGASEHKDLQNYIERTKKQSQSDIEPLPTFRPYRPFTYSVMTMRSPFEPPAREEEESAYLSGAQVQPDLDREKEYLENFNVANLTMVGTLTKEGRFWVLVDDGRGGVHPVTEGNYLGKNHGRIVEVGPTQIELMEIVSDGAGGWVERPRIIELREKG